MRLRCVSIVPGLVAGVLCGCAQNVNVAKALTVDPGAIEVPVILGAPKRDQKLLIDVRASEPVDVDVALEAKRAGIMNRLGLGKRPDTPDTLASKLKTTGETMVVTLPTGSELAVILSNATKKSNVTVKVHSQ